MIVLTGSTGTVGRHLARALLAQGSPVTALAHSPESAAALTSLGVEARLGSFDEPESLRRALAGATRLFLLTPAGIGSLRERQLRVLEAARAGGTVSHIVKLSSIAADERPAPAIIAAHRAVEEEIERSGLGWTHLRPNWFMQNELAQASAVARDAAFFAPDVTEVSMIDARDVAAVAARVLSSEGHEGRAYTLTGPEALGYRAVALVYASMLERPVQWREATFDEARRSMVASGLTEELASGYGEIMQRYRRGGVTRRVSPDVERVTGHPPRTFRQFVGEHRAAFGGSR